MTTDEQRKELFCKYQSGAKQGDLQSIRNLANCYLCGLGVEQNTGKAVELLTLATDKGDDVAALILANIYYTGSVVRKDYKKAVELYTKAAEQGNTKAKILLAKMYYNGVGVKRDSSKVIDLCTQAADNNNADGNYILGILHCAGFCDLKQDFNVGLHYLEIAKSQYERENGGSAVKRLKEVEGIIWLCNQIMQGNNEAKTIFGYMLVAVNTRLFTIIAED
jgi:hypothetical protein